MGKIVFLPCDYLFLVMLLNGIGYRFSFRLKTHIDVAHMDTLSHDNPISMILTVYFIPFRHFIRLLRQIS